MSYILRLLLAWLWVAHLIWRYVSGRVTRNGFAIVRPTGHHAEPQQAMGFCFFNSIAIAARILQREHRVHKILTFDWDVHHGNGTQDIVYDDPRVLVISIHRHDDGNFFPGTGGVAVCGTGAGVGFNDSILPIHDPPTDAYSRGKIVLAPEGSYDLPSICDSAEECVRVLLGDQPSPIELSRVPCPNAIITMQKVIAIHTVRWPCLQELAKTASCSFSDAISNEQDDQDTVNAMASLSMQHVTTNMIGSPTVYYPSM
ncbi:hypothetical protein JTB14_008742 [Gonioctena quinquepunctata]|nr:hypothetical protein JTB14_008742 [Gonioctena quinquepunctata]